MVKINQPGNLEEREHLFVLSYDTSSLKPQAFFTQCHLHCKTVLTLWMRVLLQRPSFFS